jgi:hypothetical protein
MNYINELLLIFKYSEKKLTNAILFAFQEK